jgi:hypothetical protein
MIPYSDGIAARRFPIVDVALIAANFAVFLFYELPDPDSAIRQASFLRRAAGGHVVPESPSESRVQLDDEIGNRFALIALSRLTDEQRDELSRRGPAVISIPGNGLDRWLRRAGGRRHRQARPHGHASWPQRGRVGNGAAAVHH